MRIVALSSVLLLCSCGPPPVFDEEIGREAVPIERGAAAGTFALKTVNTTLVQVPVLGDFAGGGDNYRLVTRTYDEATDTYQQSSLLCGGVNYEVAGVTTASPESTYRAVPPSVLETVTISDDGVYAADGHLQLWGLRDLPEPFSTPLPANKDEAAQSPHTERIFDMDDDGNPGITTFVSGAVIGEVYVIQRKTVTLSGIVLGADLSIGFAVNTNEVTQLGNNNILLDRQSEGGAIAHPDKKRSWFEEVRVADGFTCDDVMAASADGTISRSRPF